MKHPRPLDLWACVNYFFTRFILIVKMAQLSADALKSNFDGFKCKASVYEFGLDHYRWALRCEGNLYMIKGADNDSLKILILSHRDFSDFSLKLIKAPKAYLNNICMLLVDNNIYGFWFRQQADLHLFYLQVSSFHKLVTPKTSLNELMGIDNLVDAEQNECDWASSDSKTREKSFYTEYSDLDPFIELSLEVSQFSESQTQNDKHNGLSKEEFKEFLQTIINDDSLFSKIHSIYQDVISQKGF